MLLRTLRDASVGAHVVVMDDDALAVVYTVNGELLLDVLQPCARELGQCDEGLHEWLPRDVGAVAGIHEAPCGLPRGLEGAAVAGQRTKHGINCAALRLVAWKDGGGHAELLYESEQLLLGRGGWLLIHRGMQRSGETSWLAWADAKARLSAVGLQCTGVGWIHRVCFCNAVI